MPNALTKSQIVKVTNLVTFVVSIYCFVSNLRSRGLALQLDKVSVTVC